MNYIYQPSKSYIDMRLLLVVSCLMLSIHLFSQRVHLSYEQRLHNREVQRKNDSILKSQVKYLRTSVIVKLQLAGGMVSMKNAVSPIRINTGYGFGGEFFIGSKLAKSFSVGGGFNALVYAFDNNNLHDNIQAYYEKPHFTNITNSFKETSLTKTSLFVQGSYWQYTPKSVIEVFGKIAFTYSQYTLDFHSFNRADSTHFSELYTLSRKISLPGMMPAIGAAYHLRLSRLLYVTAAGEYGYNICVPAELNEVYHNSNGDVHVNNIDAPTPVHFLQFNVGLMFRPSNRVYPKEDHYQPDYLLKQNERNN